MPPQNQSKQQQTMVQKANMTANSHPCLIYFSFNSNSKFKNYLKGVSKKIVQKLKEQNFMDWLNKNQYILQEQLEQNLHLSLSKSFRLYRNQVQHVLGKLKKSIRSENEKTVPVCFDKITILEKKFITVEVEKAVCYQRIGNLVKKIDQVLASKNLQPYYKDPIFHITLFKLVKTKQTENIQQQKIPQQIVSNLEKTLEMLKLQKIYFSCKQLCFKCGIKVQKI